MMPFKYELERCSMEYVRFQQHLENKYIKERWSEASANSIIRDLNDFVRSTYEQAAQGPTVYYAINRNDNQVYISTDMTLWELALDIIPQNWMPHIPLKELFKIKG